MKRRLIDTSILLSLISIAVTVFINLQIAKKYLRVDGKTQALFGIKELLQFNSQYDVVCIGILSALLVIMDKNKWTSKKYMALAFSLIAMLIVFLRI